MDFLLRSLKIDKEKDVYTPVSDTADLRAATQMESAVNKPFMPHVTDVYLPENVEYVQYVPDVSAYVRKRGLSDFDCKHYGLLAWQDAKGAFRVLFPDYYNEKLVFWTARAVDESVNPKYRSATNAEKSACVWNLSRTNPAYPIYIAEGCMSARACGPNGVAIYGKSLSETQATLIAKHAGASGVRIVLDPDAYKNIVKAVATFFKMRVPVGVVLLPNDNDPDEMPRNQLTELLLQSKPLTETDWLRIRSSRL
jgi:hypothetical protein